MLAEGFDGEAGLDQGGHHLADAVIPLIRLAVLERRLLRGVIRGVVNAQRAAVEVGIAHDELVGLLLIERLHERVDFVDVEQPAGAQKARRHAGPAGNVGQPAERPDVHVDDVELLVERVGRVVELGLDEVRVVGQTGLLGQLARLGDRRRGEVEAHDRRAFARPGERVHSEMALQVQQRLAGDRTDRLAIKIEQRRLAREKAIDAVELGGGVDGDRLIPAVAIGGAVFVERHRQAGGSIAPKPARSRITSGSTTEPSDCWPLSSSAAIVRGSASPLPLRVWTKRAPLASGGR